MFTDTAGQSEDREATKRLLKACSRRAVDRLQSELDAATESPERAHRLISDASPADLAVLRNLYLRATGVTLAVTGTAFFAALPRRSRPVASAFAAVGLGSVAGAVFGGLGMADVVETIVGQRAPSVLADRMMCPAIREFDPCLDDQRCAAMMAAASSRLHRCGVLCRERSPRPELPVDGAAAHADDVVVRDDALGQPSDPFFSGGFDAPASQRRGR